jgi:hypothetical protein
MDFQNVVHSINLTNPSWDLFVLLAFVVGIGFYLMRGGVGRAFLVLLSSYISFSLVTRLALIEKVLGVNLQNTLTNKTIIFLAGILVIFFILSRSGFFPMFRQSSKKVWFKTLVISFLQIGLVISLIVSFTSIQEAKNLSMFLRYFFATDGAQFFWLVSPLLAIFLFKEK